MPATQHTFLFFSDLETRPAPARPVKRAAGTSLPAQWSKMDYDMLLTRALHRHALSHPVYAALVATAHGQFHQPAPYTITRIARALGIAYHSVIWHLRKNPDLFQLDESAIPLRVTLSAEGQKLIGDIHRTLYLYRSQP